MVNSCTLFYSALNRFSSPQVSSVFTERQCRDRCSLEQWLSNFFRMYLLCKPILLASLFKVLSLRRCIIDITTIPSYVYLYYPLTYNQSFFLSVRWHDPNLMHIYLSVKFYWTPSITFSVFLLGSVRCQLMIANIKISPFHSFSVIISPKGVVRSWVKFVDALQIPPSMGAEQRWVFERKLNAFKRVVAGPTIPGFDFMALSSARRLHPCKYLEVNQHTSCLSYTRIPHPSDSKAQLLTSFYVRTNLPPLYSYDLACGYTSSSWLKTN